METFLIGCFSFYITAILLLTTDPPPPPPRPKKEKEKVPYYKLLYQYALLYRE